LPPLCPCSIIVVVINTRPPLMTTFISSSIDVRRPLIGQWRTSPNYPWSCSLFFRGDDFAAEFSLVTVLLMGRYKLYLPILLCFSFPNGCLWYRMFFGYRSCVGKNCVPILPKRFPIKHDISSQWV
jgi:hypothetical protein